MEFKFEPERITKDLLLNYRSEEDFFRMYLGFTPQKGKSYKNPLRDDKHSGCSFFRTKNGLYFRDFARNKNYTFINVVMEKYNIGYHEALSQIANDIGLLSNGIIRYINSEKKGTSIVSIGEKADIQVTIQNFSRKQLGWWSSFGIPPSILEKYRVYSLKAVFLNKSLYCLSSEENPTYGYYFGKKNGKEIWKIYFPLKTTRRFLSNCDSSIIQGIHQINISEEYLMITKSLKDVMLCNTYNISSIAPNSETFTFSEKVHEKFSSKFNLFLLFDNDYAGVINSSKWKKKYKKITVLFIKRKYGKDLTDVYKKDNSLGIDMIQDLKLILTNQINKSKYFYIFK